VTPRLLGPLESEEEGNMILRKTGNYLPFDTAYHPKKLGYPNTADCCMLGLIFTLKQSQATAVSKSFTAVEGFHCAARPLENNTTVCISWLCNRFPRREMAQGHSHTIKINVSAVYQEALGSQNSTAATHVLAGSLVSTDMWFRIPYFYYFRTAASLGN